MQKIGIITQPSQRTGNDALRVLLLVLTLSARTSANLCHKIAGCEALGIGGCNAAKERPT